MSPYIEQAAERARLPIKFETFRTTGDFAVYLWHGHVCAGVFLNHELDRARTAYLELRAYLEDGQ